LLVDGNGLGQPFDLLLNNYILERRSIDSARQTTAIASS